MHNEVQGNHFGKIRKMTLEGCCVEYYSEALAKLTKEFHSHLSDDAGQSAATSFENMYIVLLGLKDNGLLHEYSLLCTIIQMYALASIDVLLLYTFLVCYLLCVR